MSIDDKHPIVCNKNCGWKFPAEVLYMYGSSIDPGDIERNAKIIFGILSQKLDGGVAMDSATVGSAFTVYNARCGITEAVDLSEIEKKICDALGVGKIRICMKENDIMEIEVPNLKASPQYLGRVLDKYAMSKKSFVVGTRVDGKPMTIKLRSVGAMMIAGDNSVGLPNMMDAIIASLLSQYDSNSLKLILLDPKQVCLSAYKDFLHTFCYETDATKEIDVLRWVVDEMDFRYDEMAKAKVRNIDEYNKKNISGKMPEIVVAIDEIFDHYEELEPLIVRLAQKNCATTGIHIIYSTIRPDKITTLLKGCSEIKAVFELDDENISRRLLDSIDATKLSKGNDFLLKVSDSEMVRLAGVKVSDYEINEVKSILKLDNINYDNVVALSIADGGAMGDPGLVVILEKDLSECRFHYYKVDSDKLKQKLPFFSSIELDYGKVRNVEEGWGVYYFGFGNYLFIRDEYYNESMKCLDEARKLGKNSAEIYSNFASIIREVILKK